MAAIRSIRDYVDSKCYDGLYEAASEYLETNWRSMNLRTRRVPSPDAAEIIDAKVERVYVTDGPGDRIFFDVGFAMDICVTAADRHNDAEDECRRWLRLSCEGDLSLGLNDWKINAVNLYDTKKMPDNSMSDALVPFIRQDRYEEAAEAFLREYFPEALKIPSPGQTPVYVDPMTVAQRLGLTVQPRQINEEQTVFGQIYFADKDTELYDQKQGRMASAHIKAKTIIADPSVTQFRGVGALNNTIIHECVHWDKHRKVFLLEKLYNDSASAISCEAVGGARSDVTRSATDMMEQQANRLAPRIQMPAAPFKARANYLIGRFMRESHASHEIEVMEAVIGQLVVDFQVSKQAAKIRLVELGFESAVGTLTWVDGHYVQPHSYRKGAITRNQTFTVDTRTAAIERFLKPELRTLTDRGDYLFIDNHFVYNAPLYVTKDSNSRPTLTAYALSHMDECCLVFDMEIDSIVREEYHSVCYLNRDIGNYSIKYEFHNGYENSTPEKQKALRERDMAEIVEIRKKMVDDPSVCMELLLSWCEITQTQLADAIDMSVKNIHRIVTGEVHPKFETVIRICFGLNLPPSISMRLIEVFGYKLLVNDNHLWILDALTTKYLEPYDLVIEYLADFGVNI